MTGVDGKDLVRRYLDDVFTHGNVSAMDSYLDGDKFKAGVADLVAVWRKAFTDLRIDVDDVIVEGNSVVTVEVLSGTHLGVYESSIGPVEPTGKTVRWSRIAIRTLSEGRFVAGFFEEDEIGLLRQLDAVALKSDGAAEHKLTARSGPSDAFKVRTDRSSSPGDEE